MYENNSQASILYERMKALKVPPPLPPVEDPVEQALTPKELIKFIRKAGYTGQDKAVRTAALIIHRHYSGCPSVNLFCGPTGSGKTEIWRLLAREFSNVHIYDSSMLTNEGWRGGCKISTILSSLPPIHREHSILVFDEFDKLLEPKMSSEMNITDALQNELLKLFDHDTLFFGADRPGDTSMTVDCSKVSIVLLGAFENMMKAKTRAGVSIGFGGKQARDISYGTVEITVQDLLKYTAMRPEIAGRIDRIVSMTPLTDCDYFRILLHHIDDVGKRTGKSITFHPAVLHPICQQAIETGLGARWAIHRVDAMIDDMLFDNPFDYSYFCSNETDDNETERPVTEND